MDKFPTPWSKSRLVHSSTTAKRTLGHQPPKKQGEPDAGVQTLENTEPRSRQRGRWIANNGHQVNKGSQRSRVLNDCKYLQLGDPRRKAIHKLKRAQMVSARNSAVRCVRWSLTHERLRTAAFFTAAGRHVLSSSIVLLAVLRRFFGSIGTDIGGSGGDGPLLVCFSCSAPRMLNSEAAP